MCALALPPGVFRAERLGDPICLQPLFEADADRVSGAEKSGTWLDMNLAINYFSKEYRRGNIDQIITIAELVESLLPMAEIWYGNDSDDKSFIPFDRNSREQLRTIAAMVLGGES
jgi:hypothetical protein